MLDSGVTKVIYFSTECKTQVECEDSVLKKVALLKQGGHYLLHFYDFWIPFLTFAFSTFPPLSTNLSKKKKISRCRLYILIIIPFHLFLEENITISITMLILFPLNMFHIRVFQNHSINWEKKPTNESDVIIHFLLCCVSFPSLLPFPCKEL